MPEALSIREQALRQLKANFVSQKKGVPTTDPYDFKWDVVQRQPLSAESEGKEYALAIIEGTEQKIPQISSQTSTLQVTLEWTHICPKAMDPTEAFNRVLWNIQRRIRDRSIDARTLGNPALVTDIREIANRQESIDDAIDRLIAGTVFVQILYKHDEDDPRVVPGGSI